MMNNRKHLIVFILIYLLTSCNLPEQNGTQPVVPNLTNGPVQILTPQNGATLPATTLVVQFTATGGPFIEADLLVDGAPVATAPQDGTSPSISEVLSWDQPIGGAHILSIQVLTPDKEILSASVQVTVEGAAGDQTLFAPPTSDPGIETARQRVIQIMQNDYGVSVTDPPVGRKARYGVTTDPWVSVIYYKNWVVNISLYPDGREARYVYPLNYSDPFAAPNFLSAGDKPIPMCRPNGTIKLLVVFVDYQNLGTTQQEALDSLTQAVDQINGKYLEASQAVGLQTSILQLQATGAYLSSPPAMPDHLLTPELMRNSTGLDPTQFDILVQIDLDANDTSGMAARFGTFGFASSGCGALPNDVNMWIAISKQEQLSQTSSDPRLTYTLGHEIMHTMGYPIGINGAHEWLCGDGTVPDGADQCDQNNLPTLMLGWTDTDGDGVVEILDQTPYGLLTP